MRAFTRCLRVAFSDTGLGGISALNGKTWRIKLKKDFEWAGYTDEKRHLITLDDDLRDPQETLFHELLHVVLGTKQSNMVGNVHGWIYVVSPRVVHLLQKNPPLAEYLFPKK